MQEQTQIHSYPWWSDSKGGLYPEQATITVNLKLIRGGTCRTPQVTSDNPRSPIPGLAIVLATNIPIHAVEDRHQKRNEDHKRRHHQHSDNSS